VTLSISGKEWQFPVDIQVDGKLVEAAGGSELLAKLLIRRGIKTAAEAHVFLSPSAYTPTSPMELPDISRAIIRISQAIAQGEHVTVYGDYDVDGVTGTSVLLTVLRSLGADVSCYIPNRAGEGYGLNLKAVSILASKRRTKLIITCDCGVSNFAEINFARSLGVDTIVLDHHTMPELLPPAVAVVHPKQLGDEHPLNNLPGVGVAYKLCEALLLDRGRAEEADALLDFVTLGMIADLVPLVKENRYLVQVGLPKLVESPRPGLQALLSQVKTSGGTDLVGFGLAPRINAVGRLSDANLAVELMTTSDPITAEKLARQLQTDNARRQELCDKILFEADQMVLSELNLAADKAIVIYREGWHHGVVGIVASRLVEKYHLPVFIGELDREEGVVKGSARGIEGLDLYAVLQANEQLLTRWGGHKMAAGFSLEADKADAFRRAVAETCNRMLAEKSLSPRLDIDAVVEASAVSLDLVGLLSRLAPFGMANKKPVLVLRGLVCESTRLLGKEGKHSRIMLRDPATGKAFESVLWNSQGKVPQENMVIDVSFAPEVNSYNGQDRLQLVLCDWLDPSQRFKGASAASIEAKSAAPSQSEQLNHPAPAARPGSETGAGSGTSGMVHAGLSPKPAGKAETRQPAEPMQADDAECDSLSEPKRPAAVTSTVLSWTDLRNHDSPSSVLEAAVRKLGQRLAVFAESCPKVQGAKFSDRLSLGGRTHLLLWQYPPTLQVLHDLQSRSGARSIYLVGGSGLEPDDSRAFVGRLLGLVRFAVNQREGKAEGEKIAAALGTSKMCVALGLTILKKLNIIDWFAEDGLIYLDLIEQPLGSAEELPEFRQLTNSLKDIAAFRAWCASSELKEIQLAVTPNHIDLSPSAGQARRSHEPDEFPDGPDRARERSSHLSSDNS